MERKPPRRPPSTACAVPGMPDPARMSDPHAERCVLCGLMREGKIVRAGLIERGFTKADLYQGMHQDCYDVQMYLLNGSGTAGPADVFSELTNRKRHGDATLFGYGTSLGVAVFLADVWTCSPWLVDMQAWADPCAPPPGIFAWVALAAADKVIHLAARRRAIYAAQELIRDSLNPTGGAEYLDGRIQQLDEEY